VLPQKAPQTEKPVLINHPLDFQLRDLDHEHLYLSGRGFTRHTIERFGLGFCQRGYFKDRVVIPLYSTEERLIGYAGRITNDDEIGEDCPKYLFPGTRERDGKILEFRKSEFVYNGHRLKNPVDDLVVVEGFPSVWWLSQCGFANMVALMGWSCSEEQAKRIVSLVKPHGRVWLVPDGDESGERCAECVLPQISPHRFIRWVKLEQGKQPTDYHEARLREFLNP